MDHQMAIYEQGCKRMVGGPLSRPNEWSNLFDRMQVRIFSAFDVMCLR